jgi:hypothetical protein
MGFKLSLAIGVMCGVFGAAVARADSQGAILVIPGKPGIPVIINGYDASYTIVEGDWGLARPGQVSPVIVSGPLIRPSAYHAGHYFPYQGTRPGYGRREVEPPPDQRRPRPAQSYHREWGVESQQLPATIDQQDATPLIVSPNIDVDGGGGRRWDHPNDRRFDHRDDRHDDRRFDRRHNRGAGNRRPAGNRSRGRH